MKWGGEGFSAECIIQHAIDAAAMDDKYERNANGVYVLKQEKNKDWFTLPSYYIAASGFEPDVTTDNVIQEEGTEEIIAWRRWRLEEREEGQWLLCSQSWPTIWEGPVLVADECPEPGSKHGIYALKEPISDPEFIVGVVALSGKVVVGSNGYRAERATIQRLVVTRAGEQGWFEKTIPFDLCEQLAARYQCPVDFVCVEGMRDDDDD